MLVLLIAVMAMISVMLVPVVVIIKLLVCGLIALASYFAQIKHNQYRQVIWHEANQWTIQSSTKTIQAQLVPDSYVSPWLTILCFRTETNKKLSIMIFPDAINPETFRRLRGRLKIESTKLFSKKSDLA